jgi:L-asparagine transporter-like permease
LSFDEAITAPDYSTFNEAAPQGTNPMVTSEKKLDNTHQNLIEKEAGLARQLNQRQLAMLATGGAIGTGLFLGSSFAVRAAGPSVIITYLLGALIALLLMGALAEMAAVHPSAGSFGLYAEIYLSKWAGFVSRYTFWAASCIAIGGEAVAVAIYCRFWFPDLPAWIWVVGCSLALVYVNARNVAQFGEFEYWFSTIKVVAIVLFIMFGASLLLGLKHTQTPTNNYTAHSGFFPNGFSGTWIAIVFVIYSYIGTEAVAVSAGEAKDPGHTVPRAMRTMVLRLIALYVGAVTVLVGVVAWDQIQPGGGVEASPFVTVFTLIGVPAAAHVINFVVLTAALSSMNCNLYVVSRLLFSLSRGGYAPAALGRIRPNGIPLNALLASTAGLAVAIAFAVFVPERAYAYLFGIALFGGLFAWLIIFVTHLAFRRTWTGEDRGQLPFKMLGYPYTSILGVALMLAIMATQWWAEGMRIALIAGLPWLALISLAYYIHSVVQRRRLRNPADP